MWRGAFLSALELMVALVCHPPILICAVPDFGTIPVTALPAFDSVSENSHSAVFLSAFAPLSLGLHQVKCS